MAVQAAPHRSLLGMAASAYLGRRGRSHRVSAAAAKVREHVLTVAALTAIDVGAFHVPGTWGAVAGLVVTGLSLLILDFAVAER